MPGRHCRGSGRRPHEGIHHVAYPQRELPDVAVDASADGRLCQLHFSLSQCGFGAGFFRRKLGRELESRASAASFVAVAAVTAALRPSAKTWSFSILRSATVPELRLLSSSLVSSSRAWSCSLFDDW